MSFDWKRVELEHKEKLKELCRSGENEPNVELLLAINDVIAAVPLLAPRAVRTLGKLSREEDDHIAILALMTTDSLVKNSFLFRNTLFNSDFIPELVKAMPRCIRDPNDTSFSFFSHKKLEDLSELTSERYAKALVFLQSWSRLPNGAAAQQACQKLLAAGVTFPAALPGEQITPQSENRGTAQTPSLQNMLQMVNQQVFPELYMYLQFKIQSEILRNRNDLGTAPSRGSAATAPIGGAAAAASLAGVQGLTLGERSAQAQAEALARYQQQHQQSEQARSTQAKPSQTQAKSSSRASPNEDLPPVGKFTDALCEQCYALTTSILEVVNSCDAMDLKGEIVSDMISMAQHQLDVLIRDRLTAVGFLERASPSLLTQNLRIRIRLERIIKYAMTLIDVVKNSPSEAAAQSRLSATRIAQGVWEQQELVALIEEGLADPGSEKPSDAQSSRDESCAHLSAAPLFEFPNEPEYKAGAETKESAHTLQISSDSNPRQLSSSSGATTSIESLAQFFISPPSQTDTSSSACQATKRIVIQPPVSTQPGSTQSGAAQSSQPKLPETPLNNPIAISSNPAMTPGAEDPFLSLFRDNTAGPNRSDDVVQENLPNTFAPMQRLDSEPQASETASYLQKSGSLGQGQKASLLNMPIIRQSSFEDEDPFL